MGNVHLADNGNAAKNSKESTFWLLQESEAYLYFQWTPFVKHSQDSLQLNLKKHGITQQIRVEQTAFKLQTIGTACTNEMYTIDHTDLTWSLIKNDLSSRNLNYKRIFRLKNAKLEPTNEKPTYITWELNEETCNPADLIMIFKKDASGFHRMHIVSIDETSFNFNEELQAEEEIILAGYHENNFGLFELGKC
ncbi:unnamed protein product [Schistosoma turkestanicum]|nr:unnamed protein product [Schistosoma turkestanicum]